MKNSHQLQETRDPAEATVHLAYIYDAYMTGQCKNINDAIDTLQFHIKGILNPLKTDLSRKLGSSPGATHFDISEHWDSILDFQELYNKMRIELGKEKIEMFNSEDFEKSKKVSKEDLETLIQHLTNTLDDAKYEIQKETQNLFTQSNLALTLYDTLNKTLRSILQARERQAQQLGKTY